MIFRTNNDITLNSINRLMFATETQCVLYYVGSGLYALYVYKLYASKGYYCYYYDQCIVIPYGCRTAC